MEPVELACSIAGGLLIFVAALWVLNFIAGFWLEWRAETERRRAADAQYEREERAKRVPEHITPGAEAIPTASRVDGEVKRRRIEDADARIADRARPGAFCPKRRDDGPHERGDRGKCLYCDVSLPEIVDERWWCRTCRANVPSSNGRCAKCGSVPQWR